MSAKKYNVIFPDPPWFYNNRKTGGERKNKTQFGGGASKHYPLMKDEELLDLAPYIKSIADTNCALFMWATMPRLDFALDVMYEWGFKYRTTAFVWIKTKATSQGNFFPQHLLIYGPGYYTASNAEIVILGVKGQMPPEQKMTPSVVLYPRMAHSAKPSLHSAISKMYPNGNKLEIFGRKTVSGWDVIGNGIDGIDIRQALLNLQENQK